MVVLGEFHGSQEIPHFVASLTSTAAKQGPVVLALEIPKASAASLEAYLASEGSAADRERALRDPFWRSLYQDGRQSVAMWQLIESGRALRKSGAKVELVCFDVDEITSDQEQREQAMTDALVAARAARKDTSFIVLVGGAHASKGELYLIKGFRWMARRLADTGLSFVSLNVRYTQGSIWGCVDSDPAHCGPRFLASGHRQASGVHIEASPGGTYDGWFGVGALTASPPVAFPERAVGLEQKLAALAASPAAHRLRANAAYDAADFRGCVDWLAKIAEPTADDAYDQACCLARVGERDAAVERVRAALALGLQDRARLESDDLASLRDHPRWPLKK